jgi:hypothetical protein
MAFDSSELGLFGYANGHGFYVYAEDTDTRETVMASGYFNNTDDSINLRADDIIFVIGDQGFYTLRVDAISSGSVTTELATGGTVIVYGQVADMSGTTSGWTVAPCDGVISRVWVANRAQPSDATVVGLELSNVNVTDGASASIVTIAASAAAGTISTGTADGANAVAEAGAIEITCDGAGSTAGILDVWVEIIPA